jgi:hypothetical protein
VTLEAAVFIDAMDKEPKTAAFPSYTKIIFGPADRPKPQNFTPA